VDVVFSSGQAGSSPPSDSAGGGKDPSWLSITKTALSIAGFIPVIGDFANLANAGISLYQGHYGEAALFAFSAIPVAGVLGEIGQAAKIAEEVEETAVAAESAARTFTSSDPLVADLANEIEAAYPGHVVGVNVPIKNAAGNVITDADIQLQNAIIQVKAGAGKGATTQLLSTEQAAGLPTIAYGPKLSGSVVKGIQRAGGLVTRDKSVLLEVVRP
jgi:hypothetical protein